VRKYHLVILKKPYIDVILTGRKGIESRFTKTRRVPFAGVHKGDVLLLKQSAGPVCATAVVAAVEHFDNLTPQKIHRLKQQYNQLIRGDDAYWQSKLDCRFGLLIWLEDVRTIKPTRINKKDWRAWVVLSKNQDFGLSRIFPEISQAGYLSIRRQ